MAIIGDWVSSYLPPLEGEPTVTEGCPTKGRWGEMVLKIRDLVDRFHMTPLASFSDIDGEKEVLNRPPPLDAELLPDHVLSQVRRSIAQDIEVPFVFPQWAQSEFLDY